MMGLFPLRLCQPKNMAGRPAQQLLRSAQISKQQKMRIRDPPGRPWAARFVSGESMKARLRDALVGAFAMLACLK